MQTSKRSDAQPSVEVKYWTASASDQSEIESWLLSEINGEPCLVFYASFLNWCSATVDKLKNPSAKYKSAEERVKAEEVRSVLRQQPLEVREFTALMGRYFRGSWVGGVKSGYIARPNYSASK